MTEEIPQSHIRLATTATGGAGGEHSPYYRQLLSAGYKGFIQGTIGGATLYGTFGAVIGGIVGLATMPLWGPAAFVAVPILGAAGLMKGAETFGRIGSTAAIYAEGAEMNERRRALLDRLGETKSQAEADEILALLQNDSKDKQPESVFHWKAVFVGAAIGALATLVILAFPPAMEAMHFAMAPLASMMGAEVAVGTHLATTVGPVVLAIGTAIGALAGATIGIDRHYIRKWFDISENTVHDVSQSQSAMIERQREANRLHEISKTDSPESQYRIDTREVSPYKAPMSNPLHEMHRSNEVSQPRVRVDTTGSQREQLMSPEEAVKIPL